MNVEEYLAQQRERESELRLQLSEKKRECYNLKSKIEQLGAFTPHLLMLQKYQDPKYKGYRIIIPAYFLDYQWKFEDTIQYRCELANDGNLFFDTIQENYPPLHGKDAADLILSYRDRFKSGNCELKLYVSGQSRGYKGRETYLDELNDVEYPNDGHKYMIIGNMTPTMEFFGIDDGFELKGNDDINDDYSYSGTRMFDDAIWIQFKFDAV
jgi:hypothetical protein